MTIKITTTNILKTENEGNFIITMISLDACLTRSLNGNLTHLFQNLPNDKVDA
jgi:hypothetical protein